MTPPAISTSTLHAWPQQNNSAKGRAGRGHDTGLPDDPTLSEREHMPVAPALRILTESERKCTLPMRKGAAETLHLSPWLVHVHSDMPFLHVEDAGGWLVTWRERRRTT